MGTDGGSGRGYYLQLRAEYQKQFLFFPEHC